MKSSETHSEKVTEFLTQTIAVMRFAIDKKQSHVCQHDLNYVNFF